MRAGAADVQHLALHVILVLGGPDDGTVISVGHGTDAVVVAVAGEREHCGGLAHLEQVLLSIHAPAGDGGQVASPQGLLAVAGGDTVARRARVVHALRLVVPEGVVRGGQPVLVVLVAHQGRIGDGLLEGDLCRGHFQRLAGDGGIAAAIHGLRADERILASPLVGQTEGLYRSLGLGGGHEGAQVAVHEGRVEQAIGIGLDGGGGHPDVPAPEDYACIVLGGDHGVAGLERLRSGEHHIAAGDTYGSDHAVRSDFLGVVPGLPKDFHAGGIDLHAAVALDRPELVLAGFGHDIAVGSALLAEVHRTCLDDGGQLCDDDGLDDLTGAGLHYVHGAFTDLAGQIVIQLEGDHEGLALHADEMDPLVHGLDFEVDVGDDIHGHGSILSLGHIIHLGAVRLISHFEAFSFEHEALGGYEADLGIGIGQHYGGGLHAQGRDHDLVGLHLDGELPGVVSGHADHCIRGLCAHGVGNLDGVEGTEGIGGGLDVQLERLGEGNVHRGAVAEGEDQLVLLDLDVGEDAVHEGGAFILDLSELGLLAIHLNPEETILVESEYRGLVHRHFLSGDLDGYAVDGPDQSSGAAPDDAQHRTFKVGLGADLEILHVTRGIGHGDADGLAGHRIGQFLYLGHEDTISDGALQALDRTFQRSDTGFQGADPLLEGGIVILLGAADQEQRHCNTCQ